ncbi:MAG: 4-alpha-glucanotransferase [Synergistaceae bacterium]|nr:4-alpha-glucanotransferase [Synergistaceae bacterium]
MRSAGILLPVTSLPSKYGIGDFGPEAMKFGKFLHDAGQKMWQVLPMTTIDPGCGNSPYSPTSAFAGNYLLVSPEVLVEDGLLLPEELEKFSAKYDFGKSPERVDYESARAFKTEILNAAYKHCMKSHGEKFREFTAKTEWLEDFALFSVIKQVGGGEAWYNWPDELKHRDPKALAKFKAEYSEEIARQEFYQYVFFDQIGRLKEALSELGVELVGDVPLYVTMDCADVWQNPGLFNLDEDLNPITVAGVPPDYFSATGQLWGNPTYNWDAHEAEGFRWWLARIRNLLAMFDRVRIDHFRGLVAYWAVPAGEETAKNGEWVDVPYKKFFDALSENFPEMPFWAENLGIITPDVEEVRQKYSLPGMLVLHFAWGNPAANPYAPHNHTRNSVVYTGTHDNNTSRGWFENDATESEIRNFASYIGRDVMDGYIFASEITRLAVSSVADTAIIPMQDYLRLGAESRINVPSTPSGNWSWRMKADAIPDGLADRIRAACVLYGRAEAKTAE